jgi:hypothetical protein
MTAKEKAAAIVRGYNLHMESDGPEIAQTIENAITAAVEEEREACLEIIDAWIRPGASTLDRTVGGVVALKIARKIRARGNKD